ncbi:hypothetical protein [Citreimonas salinaria]|uniref:Uncharacterized protein n=1 Tax=Citreimonas salinaria TaxID=321339 RepID=A0A1H3LL03_9RHOB|nr:hypothetical protein [Citreimonas salinaria]SDY64980.1 hypothetical protein SAMN05444340_11370 [Citreimonas salinaria]
MAEPGDSALATGAEALESFALEACELGVSLSFRAPSAVRKLLGCVLSGWADAPIPDADPTIRVSAGPRFALGSAHYVPARDYSDPVALLNELLIAMAHGVKAQRPDLVLLHGAAFEDPAGAQVVFGEKKAGKSVMTADRAARGALIYADDILLWSPKAMTFAGLGMSPRLRRPVAETILERLGRRSFIAGQHTCYLAAGALRLAPAGRSFAADRVFDLRPRDGMRPVRFYNVRTRIAQHRIC